MGRRVFILWLHPLFHETLRLLLDHPSIEMVGAECEYTTAREQIRQLQPDTIIVEAMENDRAANTRVAQILQSGLWSPRVIRLSLHDNELWVYYREQRTVSNREELLSLIQGT